jgi:hypothetical protein
VSVEIIAVEPEKMNLLSLFMRAALEARAEALEKTGIEGDIALTAGAMSSTLSFSQSKVEIRDGAARNPRAHLTGSLESMLALARGELFGPLLLRRVKVSGNPLAALPLGLVFRS